MAFPVPVLDRTVAPRQPHHRDRDKIHHLVFVSQINTQHTGAVVEQRTVDRR
jgi:hypothetical protein